MSITERISDRWRRFRHTPATVYKNKAIALLWWLFKLAFILGVAYVILYPIVIKAGNALKSKEDLYDMSVFLIPKRPTLANFQMVLNSLDFVTLFGNTLILSVGATFLQTASCALSAYALARFKFRLRGFLFFCVILMLVLPPQTYMLTTYSQFRYFNGFGLLRLFGSDASVNLLNTPLPLFILSIGCCGLKNGVFIYVMRNFFRTLPTELEEAAYVDGAGLFRIFYSVILPNAKPVLVTVSMLAFVWSWNDLYFANLLTPNMSLVSNSLSQIYSKAVTALLNATGSIAVADFWGDRLTVSCVANTGALLILAPLVILFFIAQKYFIENSERTGITGL
jgi:multiple sugar transport system permease protein